MNEFVLAPQPLPRERLQPGVGLGVIAFHVALLWLASVYWPLHSVLLSAMQSTVQTITVPIFQKPVVPGVAAPSAEAAFDGKPAGISRPGQTSLGRSEVMLVLPSAQTESSTPRAGTTQTAALGPARGGVGAPTAPKAATPAEISTPQSVALPAPLTPAIPQVPATAITPTPMLAEKAPEVAAPLPVPVIAAPVSTPAPPVVAATPKPPLPQAAPTPQATAPAVPPTAPVAAPVVATPLPPAVAPVTPPLSAATAAPAPPAPTISSTPPTPVSASNPAAATSATTTNSATAATAAAPRSGTGTGTGTGTGAGAGTGTGTEVGSASASGTSQVTPGAPGISGPATSSPPLNLRLPPNSVYRPPLSAPRRSLADMANDQLRRKPRDAFAESMESAGAIDCLKDAPGGPAQGLLAIGPLLQRAIEEKCRK